MPFPNVQYLAIDTAEKHLLAFTATDDNAHWVDLTALDVNGLPVISALPLPTGTFSRPVVAFFSTDNTKAFILNCGLECGGSSNPSVTEIDVTTPAAPSMVSSTSPPTSSTSPVPPLILSIPAETTFRTAISPLSISQR
jgi:hypothetical protein